MHKRKHTCAILGCKNDIFIEKEGFTLTEQ